jgi:hypothetical protein
LGAINLYVEAILNEPSHMGLDMRPMGKPKPGFEKRYNQIFRIIQGTEKQELSFLDKLRGKKRLAKDDLLKEWFENQIPSYETIRAPKVGRDKVADEWIKEKYQESDKKISESEFINRNEGYFVIELAQELDGIPMYIAMNQDRNVFRGQFIQDCADLIGEDLVSEAWNTKLAKETLDYGQKLMTVGDEIAEKNNLQYLKQQRKPPEAEETSIEWKLHIVYSLAKWLVFYGKNGHGYEADF